MLDEVGFRVPGSEFGTRNRFFAEPVLRNRFLAEPAFRAREKPD